MVDAALPAVWIAFSENGNIRAWTRDHNRARQFMLSGWDPEPLYGQASIEEIEHLRLAKAELFQALCEFIPVHKCLQNCLARDSENSTCPKRNNWPCDPEEGMIKAMDIRDRYLQQDAAKTDTLGNGVKG